MSECEVCVVSITERYHHHHHHRRQQQQLICNGSVGEHEHELSIHQHIDFCFDKGEMKIN